MLLKIALWYVNHYANKTPAGMGYIDANGTVQWPANG